MSSLAKASISISKKDLSKSRIPPVASRNIVFYHKATAGQATINLLALSMPSEMPTNVQATIAEISGAQLYNNKKNLSLMSSSKSLLQQGIDYIVTSGTTILLTGPGYASGADIDEIFTGVINSAPMSDLVVASAKTVTKTYELAVGSTVLNLGLEYEVGVNPNDDVGIIKVFVNGVLAHRDVDYTEVDAGSGYGTTIRFFAAPVSIPYQIAVDFGVNAITDNNSIGTIESLSGSVLAIANDLAIVAGTSVNDYLTASPSDIERRVFGDTVLDLDSKYDTTQNLSIYTKTKWQRKILAANVTAIGAIASFQFNNLTIGKSYKLKMHIRNSNATADQAVTATNGSTIVGYTIADADGGGTVSVVTESSSEFVAEASTITFTVSSAGALTIVGNNTLSGSYVTLEELPNHEITTQWT